uniref:Uncharacterized protein n=1 Tax=Babesia bovis TaxID=5865 RepID=S6C9I4_BABBO|nr:hypothetical protein [Babesia bovis]
MTNIFVSLQAYTSGYITSLPIHKIVVQHLPTVTREQTVVHYNFSKTERSLSSHIYCNKIVQTFVFR